MLAQIRKALDSFVDRWDRPRRYPPQHRRRAVVGFEPLATVAHHPDVCAPINVLLQVIDRLPYRHVDEHGFVAIRPDAGRISCLALKPPDKVVAGVSQGIVDVGKLRNRSPP